MSKRNYCGLDFGTSNSTLSIIRNGSAALAMMEGKHPTIPSTLFFDFEENSAHFGRDAIATYMEGGEGRMMRALKSILGSSTIHDTTMIGKERKPFTALLGLFLLHMKKQAEAEIGDELTHVVMGRPVRFVDHDETADQAAQETLGSIAKSVGFQKVEFEYEPVAAARDFQQTAQTEEIALIIDIGGGTSDFTILKVAPTDGKVAMGGGDILANAGIHVGGTDFDRWISLKNVMPLLGYQSPMIKEGRLMPVGYYHDLATWQKINFLYDHKTSSDLRILKKEAKRPELLDRLLHLLELREGHRMALGVESSKVTLSEETSVSLSLAFLEPGLEAVVTRSDLEEALENGVQKVKNVILEALTQSGLKGDDISVVFLTGGSTKVPYVRQSLTALTPNARLMDGDAFGSVGIGLALEAHKRFA